MHIVKWQLLKQCLLVVFFFGGGKLKFGGQAPMAMCLVPNLWILSWQARDFHILLDKLPSPVPPSLLRCPPAQFIIDRQRHKQHTPPDPFIIITFTFNVIYCSHYNQSAWWLTRFQLFCISSAFCFLLCLLTFFQCTLHNVKYIERKEAGREGSRMKWLYRIVGNLLITFT